FIDQIARATRDCGHRGDGRERNRDGLKTVPYTEAVGHGLQSCSDDVGDGLQAVPRSSADRGLDAREVILQRRSALAFDGHSSIRAEAFYALLSRVMPGPHPPWDALWWDARIHFLLFVHRVEGVEPG